MRTKRIITAALLVRALVAFGLADPPATPSPPAVAEIRLDADPRKGLKANRGQPVHAGSAGATRFKLLPGLKDSRFVSLEPVDSPGAYLRHQNGVVFLHLRPTKVDPLFESNASFRLIRLEGNKVRFEASGLTDRFITARKDGSVVLALNPPPEGSTFVLTPVDIPAENSPPSPPQPVAPATPETPAATAELVTTYRNSLVFVTGQDSAGSGFLANYGTGCFLFTNAHVAAGVKGAAYKTLDGTEVKVGPAACAVDHDVFLFQATPRGKPLDIMLGVDEHAAIGDEVVVLETPRARV